MDKFPYLVISRPSTNSSSTSFLHRSPDVADVHRRGIEHLRLRAQDSRPAGAANVGKFGVHQRHVLVVSLSLLQVLLRRLHRQEAQARCRQKSPMKKHIGDLPFFRVCRFLFCIYVVISISHLCTHTFLFCLVQFEGSAKKINTGGFMQLLVHLLSSLACFRRFLGYDFHFSNR